MPLFMLSDFGLCPCSADLILRLPVHSRAWQSQIPMWCTVLKMEVQEQMLADPAATGIEANIVQDDAK